jgi:hypothetical protein
VSTLAHLELKWSTRLAEWRRLGVSVSGEKVAEEILSDVKAIGAERSDALLSPAEAGAVANYHPESICRLVRTGKVKNYGTKHRPRVKLGELPTKAAGSSPCRKRRVAKPTQSDASSGVRSIDSIARDALAGRIGRQ